MRTLPAALVLLFACGATLVLGPASAAARVAAKPAPVPAAIRVPAVAVDATRQDLVEALRAAKAAGEETTARALATRLTSSPARAAVPASNELLPSLAGKIRIERGAPPAAPQLWGDDVLVTDPAWTSTRPAMVCAAAGTLFAAVEQPGAGRIDVCRSQNGGASWQYLFHIISEASLTEPCLAIGEGTTDRLLVAFVMGSGTAYSCVMVVVQDLEGGPPEFRTALSFPGLAITHPRICVDSPEYSLWYPYLVAMVQSIDTDAVCFTRSLDFGVTWEPSTTLATGVTLQDWSDIDFGGTTLAIAYTLNDGDSSLRLRLSRDLGGTWEPPIVLTGAGLDELEPRLAATTSGDLLIVTFARRYAPQNCDIECFWSSDQGSTWNYDYLPYTSADERRPSIVASPQTGRLQATYWREGEIRHTWADLPLTANWSPSLAVNDQPATADTWPVIVAQPIPLQQAGIAWAAAPVAVEGIYFDAISMGAPAAIEYLVLCPDSLAGEAERLAAYRRARGLTSGVVQLSDVVAGAPTADAIDAWLESFWEANPGLRFVALIGGVSLLPSFPFVSPDSGEPFFSDLRYAYRNADFPGSYLPQLVVGRLPVDSRAQFAAAIDKIQRFEAGYGERNRVVFFGHLPEMGFVATRDSALAVSLGYAVTTLYTPTEAELIAALNTSRVAMAFYYGHGSFVENWPLHTGNLGLLTNFDRPWLYFSGGCSFNDDYSHTLPLGHTLLLGGVGSAASTGAAVAGGYGYNYAYAEALLYQSRGQQTIGETVAAALYQHQAAALGAGQDVSYGSWVYWFTERMRFIGDPALRIDGDVTAVPLASPAAFLLAQNRPNPFRAATTIHFTLPSECRVQLAIYSATGRRVARLLNGPRAAGLHTLTWDGRDAQGRPCASGIYFCRLEAGSWKETRRMALVK